MSIQCSLESKSLDKQNAKEPRQKNFIMQKMSESPKIEIDESDSRVREETMPLQQKEVHDSEVS